MTKIYQDWPQNARNSQNFHSSWKTLRTSWKNYVQPPFYWPLKVSKHFAVLVQMIWLVSRSLEFLQVNFSSICRVVLDGTPNVNLSAWVAIDASEEKHKFFLFELFSISLLCVKWPTFFLGWNWSKNNLLI